MSNDFLNEIYVFKTFDARSYPINKRGNISLINYKSIKIYIIRQIESC